MCVGGDREWESGSFPRIKRGDDRTVQTVQKGGSHTHTPRVQNVQTVQKGGYRGYTILLSLSSGPSPDGQHISLPVADPLERLLLAK